MSKDASRFSDAAAFAHLVEDAIHTSAAEDNAFAVDDVASETALDTEPWPPEPASPARVGLSRNAHAHSYNDPSNYLG